MHAADPMIAQFQQSTQQLVRTYKNTLNAQGTFVTAVSQFENNCLQLLEEGWQLKQVVHQGSVVSPYTVIATYKR